MLRYLAVQGIRPESRLTLGEQLPFQGAYSGPHRQLGQAGSPQPVAAPRVASPSPVEITSAGLTSSPTMPSLERRDWQQQEQVNG